MAINPLSALPCQTSGGWAWDDAPGPVPNCNRTTASARVIGGGNFSPGKLAWGRAVVPFEEILVLPIFGKFGLL